MESWDGVGSLLVLAGIYWGMRALWRYDKRVRQMPRVGAWPIPRRVRTQPQANAVYLIVNPSWGAAKIGVSGNIRYRLAAHQKYGWRVHSVWHVPPGSAYGIEQATLRWVRRYTRQIGCPAVAMPQGGSSETWPLAALSADAVAFYVQTTFFQNTEEELRKIARRNRNWL